MITIPVLLSHFWSASIRIMVRIPLSPEQRDTGRRLGELFRMARGPESMVAVAARCGLSVDTVRKIETGRVPTPAFTTVAILAQAVGLSLDALATELELGSDSPVVRTA
jgi:transcriptional regulator with XRE-family HTH domain